MPNQQLADYIKQRRDAGFGDEEIRRALLDAGWPEEDIRTHLNISREGQSIPDVPPRATELRGTFKLLGDSLAFFKNNFRTLFIVTIFSIIIPMVLGILSSVGFVSLLVLALKSSPYFLIVLALLFVLFLILMILFQVWAYSSLIYAVKDSGERIGAGESLRRGWRKINSLFITGVIGFFIILGGYVLFFVPGLIFSMWFALSMLIVVAEDKRGLNALLASKEYVRGYWGRVFGRLLLFSILTMVIAVILGFLGGVTNFKYTANIISPIISLLIVPVGIIFLFFIYKDLKSIKGELPEPTRKQRTTFISFGVLGLVVLIGMIVYFVWAGSSLISGVKVFNSGPNNALPSGLDLARARARDAQRISDINQIRAAIENYYDANRSIYPTDLSDNGLGAYLTGGKVPVDPATGSSYFYAYDPAINPKRYHLWTELETYSNALNSDFDLDSTMWAAGDRINAGNTLDTERCVVPYNNGLARDCIYDLGQK